MIKVYKFGGSVLKDISDIKKISEIIQNSNFKTISIFSAFYKVTDTLLSIYNKHLQQEDYRNEMNYLKTLHLDYIQKLELNININPFFEEMNVILSENKIYTPSSLDRFVSIGERLATRIMSSYIRNTFELDATELIQTDSRFGSANLNNEKSESLIFNKLQFTENNHFVISGFIGSNNQGQITTLGRNGSDLSAGIIANAINADELIIFKDVDGLFAADPKIVKDPHLIKHVNYQELQELSYLGNKIIHPKTIDSLEGKNIPIILCGLNNVKNISTRVSNDTSEYQGISGITQLRNIAIVSVKFKMMSNDTVNKLLDNQNVISISEIANNRDVSFLIKNEFHNNVESFLNQTFGDDLERIHIMKNKSIVSIIGRNLSEQVGISGKIFNILQKFNINIYAINDGLSPTRISFIIENENTDNGVRILYNELFHHDKKLSILLLGVGVVGGAFLQMLQEQYVNIAKKYNTEVNILGIGNSKKILFHENNHKKLESDGVSYNSFGELIQMCNSHDNFFTEKVLIDATSSENLVLSYDKFVAAGFHIITPNKKFNTLAIDKHIEINNVFQKYKKKFYCSANVGAGLPILSTIKDLVDAGDQILKIEGIFSGTLSYIFNHLDKNNKFSDVVKKAQELGFTEPDPRSDLSGEDVARKLLIIARLIGYKINLEDIKVENLIPVELSQEKWHSDLYNKFQNIDHEFEQKVINSIKNESVLRYVGTIENGVASAGIKSFLSHEALASVSHTDNIVAIHTKYYNNTPLVIKGAGAGAHVTGIGIFSDLLKLIQTL